MISGISVLIHFMQMINQLKLSYTLLFKMFEEHVLMRKYERKI